MFVYFPLQDCLLNNSIQQALLKPHLILRTVPGAGRKRKIKINKELLVSAKRELDTVQNSTPQGGQLYPVVRNTKQLSQVQAIS